MDRIMLDTSVVNRPPGFFADPLIRLSSILWSWTFGQTGALTNALRGPKGELNLKYIMHFIKMILVVVVPGSLAMSFLVDKYEDWAIKRRLDRRRIGEGDVLGALVEIMDYGGMLGLYGTAANTILAGVRDGSFRGLSVDGRVVMLRCLYNICRALSNLVLQHGTATYETVFRPLMTGFGGNGYLQDVEIIANLLGDYAEDVPLANEESRYIRRTNVENYLRAAGRGIGYEVRLSADRPAVSTPARPFLGKMVLSAYADDPAGFKEAHQGAIDAARSEGRADPVDYVRAAYAARHPFNVFRTKPNEAEYRRLLDAMSDEGQEQVREALRLFNKYGESIGMNAIEPRVGRGTGQDYSIEEIRRRIFQKRWNPVDDYRKNIYRNQ
jgi:hypothetical protein